MKKFALALPTVLAALPAAAHEGGHLHPHGSETGMMILTALLVAGVALIAVWRR